jgi:hypothetical protein
MLNKPALLFVVTLNIVIPTNTQKPVDVPEGYRLQTGIRK